MTFDKMFEIESWHDGRDILLMKCPGCDERYTHHDKVEIFDRDEYYGSEDIHTVVEGAKVIQDSDMNRNPSDRRGGILIHFWCETCETRSVLRIAQHKGVTWLDTRSLPEHIMGHLL